MRSSSLRRLCLGGLATAFILVALSFFFVHQRSESDSLAQMARRDLASARQGYEALEAADTRLLSASAELLMQDEALRSAFAARDRARLLGLAEPIFSGLRARYNITHFYFHEPPPAATCFLRVHSPRLFGDKVARSTYAAAVASGGFGTGKELGQTAFALRAVHAWHSQDGKRVLGYLELGEEIGHFLGQLKAQTGDDYALLLDKRKLDSVVWMHMRNAAGQPNDWGARPLYVLAQDTGVVVRDLEWNGSLDRLPEEGRVLGMDWANGVCLMRGVFPVEDAMGQRAGAVLMARDMTALLRHSRARHVLSVALVLVLTLGLGILAGWLLARTDPAPADPSAPGDWRQVFGPLPPAIGRAWREFWAG